jgi:hypothetical protein
MPIAVASSGQLVQITPLPAEATDRIPSPYAQSLILQFFQLGQMLSLSQGRPTINFRFRRWTMQSPSSTILGVHETVPKSKVVLHIALTFRIISARAQAKS